MIKQYINIDDYWEVIVYYNVNYNLFYYIVEDLKEINTTNKTIRRIYNTMISRKAKGVTLSNIYHKTSIVLFNYHYDKYDYINSIVHEAEHIKQAMLKAYHIADEGETPAYTIGFIVMKMLEKKIIKYIGFNNL